MPVGDSVQELFDADQANQAMDSFGLAQGPQASFSPPQAAQPPPMSPANAPPPTAPTSQPAQAPDEVRAAQQAILSSPALSDQQKQAAIGALPKVPPAATPAPAGPPAPATPPGIAQMQGDGAGPVQGVPYSRGPAGPPASAAPGGMTPEMAMQLARASQGAAAPPGWHPTSRTTEGVEYSPERLATLGQMLRGNRDVAQAQLDLEGKQGAAQGRADQILAAYDDAQALQDRLHRQAQESELGKYHDHIEQLQRVAQDRSTIDEGHFFHSKSVGQKILLGLGMALRGFSFGMTGHGDPMEWLNEQIKEDVDAQKARAASARQDVGDAINLYAFNKSRLGDDDRAYEATKLAQRQSLISELQRQVGNASAELAMRLRAAQLAQGLAKENDTALKDLDEKTGKYVTSEAFRERAIGQSPAALLHGALDIKKTADELAGVDQGTRLKEAEIADKQGAGSAAQKGQEEISKAYQSAGIPAAQTALDRADDLVRGGAAARSLATLGLPRQTAVGGIVGNVAAGADARELHAVLRQVAEAQAHASGQRGVEAIEYNLKNIMGNGTEEDIRRGLQRARASIDAQKSAIQAGATPASAAGFTDRQQRSGAEQPPGFQPGVMGGP